MGFDGTGGMTIGEDRVSLEEASDRLSELQDRLRLLAVADKTIRMVTTDERTGQKSEIIDYVFEHEPARMYFKESPPTRSGRQQRRAQRKKTATTQPQNSTDRD